MLRAKHSASEINREVCILRDAVLLFFCSRDLLFIFNIKKYPCQTGCVSYALQSLLDFVNLF